MDPAPPFLRTDAAVAAAGVSGDGRSLAVTSPLAGRITAAPIVLGSFVDAGEELYQIVNPNGLQVEVALPSEDASRIQPGDEAALIVGDGREIGANFGDGLLQDSIAAGHQIDIEIKGG